MKAREIETTRLLPTEMPTRTPPSKVRCQTLLTLAGGTGAEAAVAAAEQVMAVGGAVVSAAEAALTPASGCSGRRARKRRCPRHQ